ncbi:MAG TPA: BlaI/MecI/CopY family transcriptional regulator [Pirellulales bacterium]|jgi:predicted transcriptional regulator|nr:BlaI/MecI/CopY family transcriptional regulator [Pirellulales bacterium]
MSAKTPRVADAELAVLDVLWKHGPETIRQVMERLYPAGTTSDYATVQKLMERLERKRCVSRDRGAMAHIFTATVGPGEIVGQRLQEVAQQLCEGSLTPLLMHLVRSTRLKPQERAELRKLFDESARSKKAGR